jgi:DNA-binding XRE family transcriptional regulator
MTTRPQVLAIKGVRYVLITESEYLKSTGAKPRYRRTPKGKAVETLDALQFAARSIGKKIAALRQESGLTQLELARKAGLRPETVSRIERGEANPTARTIASLLKAMGDAR